MLSWLNDKQRLAVEQTDWPVLIVAGAWSWKTKTLTHRIANILSKWVNPWEVVAVTFTNKAWDEMRSRIKDLLEKERGEELSRNDLPFMWTFHSFCLKILRSEIELIWFQSDFVIYDTQDQESAMKQVMKRYWIDPKEIRPKLLLNYVSSFKNLFLSPKEAEEKSVTQADELNCKLYGEYQELLRQNNAVDFDDILFYTVKIIKDNQEVLEKYSNRFKYLCVDEYQDTNHVQYLLIKYLASIHKNICVIWDADQSIYSFRWADIRNILDFQNDFEWCNVIKLEQNYRSTQIILDAADQVISNNTWRHEKRMWSNSGYWSRIRSVVVNSERSEWDFVAWEISRILKASPSKDLSSFAVFYRTNAQSRAVEESMMREGIIYKIIWWIKFYSRKEVKDILAYMRFIYNSMDSVSLLRIINVPARKIWNTTIAKLQNFAWQRSMSIWEVLRHTEMMDWLSAWAKKSITNFAEMIESLRSIQKELTLSEFIDLILEKTSYLSIFKWDSSPENQSRTENLMELKSVASKFDHLDEGALWSFLEEVSLIQDTDNLEQWQNALTLMTIHAAKWLEFDTVFVVWMEDGIFPSSRVDEDEFGLEEERRLAYVAITRAKEHLYLLSTRNRMLYWKFQNNRISRFVWEISKDLIEQINSSFSSDSQNGKSRSNWVNTPSWANF